MASSQILIFGLVAGGFVLLAFLLVYTILLSFHWRKQAMPASPQAARVAGGLSALVARFSDSTQLSAPEEPAGLEADGQHPPALVSTREWLGILSVAIGCIVWAELSLVDLMKTDVNLDIRTPLLGLVIACVLFVLVSHKVDAPVLPLPFKAILPERLRPPMVLWLTNLFLSLILLDSIDRDLPPWTSYVLLGAWLLNILLFCWNVFQAAGVSLPSRDTVIEWWRAHRLEVLLIALIGLAALLLRMLDLAMYPYPFINDEGQVGREALSILRGDRSTFFLTTLAGQPLISFLPATLSVNLFGNTDVAVRLLSALQGTLAVIFLYLFAREAFNRPTAFFAACLLIALPWHVHFSRLGIMNISDSFFSTGALWLTYRALRRGNYINYLLAGLMTGFSLYSYAGSPLVVVMVIGVLAYAVVRQRNYLQTHLRHLAVLVLAFLVVASPIILLFSHHSDEFISRINAENLLADNKLEDYSANAGMKPSDFLLRQLRDSAMVFIALPGLGLLFDSPRPYLDWWAAIFFILGMGYTVWRFKEVRYMLLLGWFWVSVIIGSALTQSPPSHQGMLSAAPALALLTALGLWKLAQSIQQIIHLPARWVMTVCVLIVGFTSFQDAHYYFVGEFRTGHHFEFEVDEFAYEVGKRAAELGPDYHLLLIGEPDIFAEFANFHFLSPYSDVEDFNIVTTDMISGLSRERGMFFAAIPSRVGELQFVADSLPGGKWIEVPRHTQEGISYYGYILPGPVKSP